MSKFMRIVVMFDLPVITENERKVATKFRKYLLDDGFIMMQYSVYSRICKNNDDLYKHINRLKINTPKTGNVRLLQVTENQYNNMIMFSGNKKTEENISIENLLVFQLKESFTFFLFTKKADINVCL